MPSGTIIAADRSAARFFDEHFGLCDADLNHALAQALAKRADYADLYFEYRTQEAIQLEEGLVKHASASTTNGVGVRVLAGEKTGYAFTDDITIENLEVAARTARLIAQDGAKQAPARVSAHAPDPHNLYDLATVNVPLSQKLDLLQRLDATAREFDNRISDVFVSLNIEHKVVLIGSSEGWVAGDIQPLLRVDVRCIAEAKGRRQSGNAGGGGRIPFDVLTADHQCENYAREAARRALVNLDAIEAPAGSMDVVLGSGWPGILLHEAVGHGLEADFNRRKTSAFADRLGDRVASELCTVVDDGSILSRRGSLNLDDEGTPTQRNVLIEKGILCGYLQDRLNASLMGMSPTGNGRRESYAHIPMPRMTNTFMLAGDSDPQDVIRSVKRGVYAVSFGGGQVDITSGKFVFSANEAYLIEGGRVGQPIRGATLIGNGPDVLRRVALVGTDLQLDNGLGVCGKNGQSVPVGVGLPTIRINGIVVGGTSRQGSSQVLSG